MKVLAVLGVKGGAGKTTLALHWAIEPAMFGPVMLLDMTCAPRPPHS